nr:hypothetical protein CFP56_11371 [Quercus suber]
MCMSLFDSTRDAPSPGSALSTTRRTGTHHQSLRDLKLASEEGCYLCYELNLEYEEAQEDETQAEDSPASHAPNFLSYDLEAPSRQICRLSFLFEDIQFATATYEIVRTAWIEIPASYSSIRAAARSDLPDNPCRVREAGFESQLSDISESTGDPQVAKVAKRWLEQCLAGHEKCNHGTTSRDRSWCPKRLLDISAVDGRPRLILTAHEKPSARYATLSHCWGTNHSICTLTDLNTAQYQRSIPLEVLTNTFRDAVTTARRLNLRYLWIDSLCIQQSGPGSREDWLEHAGAMRLVYSNSILNICAARAEGGEDGAFVSRPKTQVMPCCIVWTSFLIADEAQAVWTIRRGMRHTATALRMLPLFTRGWVVQERFLAPRNLHFGADRIWWECNELALAEESFPTGFQAEGVKYEPIVQWPFSLSSVSETSRALLLDTDADPQREMWEDLIEQYKQCDLSFPDKDTFLAFAGVAEKFGEMYAHDYVAGFFRQHLPFALLWISQGERSKTSRAPSWSWASIDGQILTRVTALCPVCDRCCTRLADVQDVEIDLVDPSNTYGPIKSAQLTLHGRLIPCHVQRTKTFHTGLLQPVLLYPSLDPGASPQAIRQSYDAGSTIFGEAQIDSAEDAMANMASVARLVVWALPIAETIPMLHPYSTWHRHRGLLVRSTGDGRYTRIGVYYVDGYVPGPTDGAAQLATKICLV